MSPLAQRNRLILRKNLHVFITFETRIDYESVNFLIVHAISTASSYSRFVSLENTGSDLFLNEKLNISMCKKGNFMRNKLYNFTA